jgi:hypothetical protein
MSNISDLISSYQVSTSAKEIMDILTKSHRDQVSLMWQNFQDHRVIHTVQNFEMGQFRKKIRISFDDEKNKLDPKLPVYVKIPFRETIFKGQIGHISPREVFLTLPQEIHMREFRETLRTRFELGKKTVSIRPNMENIPSDKLPIMRVTLLDISQTGMGLVVSESNLHFFRKGCLIDLMGVQESLLDYPMLGEVVHLTRQSPSLAKKGFPYRLGVKMVNKIPETVISSI